MAAIRRSDYSRSVKCLWRDQIITAGSTFFDYGCGHVDDLAALRQEGVDCDGCDPVFRPAVAPQMSDVVNIGSALPRSPRATAALRRHSPAASIPSASHSLLTICSGDVVFASPLKVLSPILAVKLS